MTKQDIYDRLKKIQTIAWRGDDLMEQEDLFQLQGQLADLVLMVAQDLGDDMLQDLVRSFPYLYSIR